MESSKGTEGPDRRRIVFGSRRSRLALWQTRSVVAQLQQAHPDLEFSIQEISTRGDRIIDQPLPEIGGKGLFTAELDQALADQSIDIAVHSLKDLPTEASPDIAIIPIMKREDPRDVLVSKSRCDFMSLRSGAVVGTSSNRRMSQLLALRDDIEVRPIRGNVPTRIEKVRSGDYDAAVIAAAGVIRIGLSDEIAEWFSLEQVLPAPGQAMIAGTCRRGDELALELLQGLQEQADVDCVQAERSFLATLDGGCSTPLAAHAVQLEQLPEHVELTGRVASLDGKTVVTRKAVGAPDVVGRQLAAEILHAGGAAILEELQGSESTGNLLGRRVVVTRAVEQADSLAELLDRHQASSIEMPLIQFRSIVDAETAQPVLQELTKYDWILFTSSNSIRFFFDLLGEHELPPSVKVACVGQKSATTLSEFGCQPDFMPTTFSGSGLAGQIPVSTDQKILYPSALVVASRLQEDLQERGCKVTRWPIYETLAVEIDPERRQMIRQGVDVVTFASPSAVSSFCEQMQEYRELLDPCTVACIGPMTRQRAESLGVRVDVTPDEHTTTGLVQALVDYFRKDQSSQE